MKPSVVGAETIHYVEFYFDQPHRHENDPPVRIRSRSVRDFEIPNDAFAFCFFDLIEVKTKLGRRMFTLSQRVNESRTYHYGDAFSVAAAIRKYPNDKFGILGLRKNGAKRVLRSLFGQWYPLEPRDVVINPKRRRKK